MSFPAVTARPGALDAPRVGLISFLNCRPLLWGLRRTGSLPGIRLLSAELAGERLVSGELDMGPISLAEYLRHTDDLLLLPGLAIAAEGAVMSCNIVSPGPLDTLRSPRVGLTSTSRTTALLARILLEDVVGLSPAYFTGPPDPAALLEAGDVAVVIGDPALRAFFDGHADAWPHGPWPTEEKPWVHDTAALWTGWTGLPMVFAVWAVRREYARRRPEAVADALHRLLHARDLALGALGEVAERAAEASGFTRGQLELYYRTLRYDLDPRCLLGLARFADLAAARGEVPARRDVELFDAGAGR
ncbi:menaquinone biosynthetic enzyme MqnA/MqnD family protein [Streptomyces sp. NPDC059491]|uniref:menaquinone biosynthetic enzyme MqnA/MqnD family protein n=1 Tax=Streptomyces sp. NPDC059491 TaxID=3346850 RepID=UPI0036C77434